MLAGVLATSTNERSCGQALTDILAAEAADGIVALLQRLEDALVFMAERIEGVKGSAVAHRWMELNVVVSNAGVGHDFPGGTIDVNEASIHLIVRDAEDRTIYQSGAVDADSELDATAHRYLSVPVDRHGRAVSRHDLFNMTGESYRRVTPAGESEVAGYRVEIAGWAKSPLVVDATPRYRKLNTRYPKWALGETYQALPIVAMTHDTHIVEVRPPPGAIGD